MIGLSAQGNCGHESQRDKEFFHFVVMGWNDQMWYVNASAFCSTFSSDAGDDYLIVILQVRCLS